MNAQLVQAKLYAHLKLHSGLEQKRAYLGMSGIANCARRQYLDFVAGKSDLSLNAHLGCYVGYMFERDTLLRLDAAGIRLNIARREVVADFDPRFRGHVDAETTDGDLVEIKSANANKFLQVSQQARALMSHYLQVQAYLRYGPWDHALLIYINRDTFEHRVLDIARSDRHGAQVQDKAQYILSSIDTRTPPSCTCGKCPQG